MKEPREWLQRIINDQYAMPSTHEYACKLYNLLRRQVGRRKRCMERRDLLLARIAELEALVERAYREGFSDGHDDDTGQRGDFCWEHSEAKKALEPPR